MDLKLNTTFEVFFKHNFPRLRNYASHIIENNLASDDIVQEAFLKLWNYRDSVKTEAEAMSFMFKTVRNSCLNYIKRNKIEEKYIEFIKSASTYQSLYIKDFTDEKDKEKFYSEVIKELNKALNKLPEKYKEVFEMSNFRSMTYKEIASEKKISLSTVERYMSKSKDFLKSELNKGGYVYSMFITYMLMS